MNKSVGPPASSQAEVTFEMTIPGNCVDTSAKKVSADLEEDSKEYSPTALTYNVFDGGSKRSRHSNGASRRCTFGWEWGWRYEWNGCNTSPFELGHAHEKPKVPLEKEKQMSKLCEKKWDLRAKVKLLNSLRHFQMTVLEIYIAQEWIRESNTRRGRGGW
jgi:hypothetical protein